MRLDYVNWPASLGAARCLRQEADTSIIENASNGNSSTDDDGFGLVLDQVLANEYQNFNELIAHMEDEGVAGLIRRRMNNKNGARIGGAAVLPALTWRLRVQSSVFEVL